jgi:hypothetical protein
MKDGDRAKSGHGLSVVVDDAYEVDQVMPLNARAQFTPDGQLCEVGKREGSGVQPRLRYAVETGDG